MEHVIAYTDGSYKPNDEHPENAGWGVVYLRGSRRVERSGDCTVRNSSEAELHAILHALLPLEDESTAIIRTDCLSAVTQWKNIISGNREPKGIWEDILRESQRHSKIEIEHVQGHSGDKHNARAHKLSRRYIERRKAESKKSQKPNHIEMAISVLQTWVDKEHRAIQGFYSRAAKKPIREHRASALIAHQRATAHAAHRAEGYMAAIDVLKHSQAACWSDPTVDNVLAETVLADLVSIEDVSDTDKIIKTQALARAAELYRSRDAINILQTDPGRPQDEPEPD